MTVASSSLHNSRRRVVLACGLTAALFIGLPAHAADDPPVEVPLTGLQPLTLTFSAFDPARVLIDEAAVLRELVASLRTRSKWPLKTNGANTIERMIGLRTVLDSKKQVIRLQYVHIDRHASNGAEYGQFFTVPVGYQIERGDKDLRITLQPPESAELTTRALFLFSPPKLGPADELLQDLQANVLAAAKPIKLRFSALAKGEVNAGFKPESVLGNFERLMGRHTYGYREDRVYDLKRDNVFSYRVGQERVALKLAVFPYRDGTKAQYEARLPYAIASDGSTEGFDSIDKLRQDVEKVIND